jgi:predicted O-linked N-acetylglucosamine transferase (SPINDLY family)
LTNLGNMLMRWGRPEEAETRCRAAVALSPEDAEPYTNLGNALKERGELDAAIDSYRRAAELRPDLSALHSNLLLTLHYHPDYSAEDLAREHRRWAERHVAPLASRRRPHSNDRRPDRRLRIGYVSADFREHSVARFMLPILEAHDRDQVEVYAYSDVTRPDAVTRAVRSNVDAWRNVCTANDAQVAELIRGDAIDVLVDLAAHSGRNRLLAFAEKPAPVQATYLAYCSTTGVDAIDYRLTDRFLDPPGADLSPYTERSIRLPDCYWCYAAPTAAGGGAPIDNERIPGPPTFGCLNNFAKVTPAALRLWARLLLRVTEARLLLYARPGNHRDRVLRTMRDTGVAESRIAFVDAQPFEDYLRTYREVDVALDPFPFCGGTTTCDALWMGVPVVSLTGRTAVSRAGSSLLSNAGLKDLVASTEAQYADLAAALLRDRRRLAELRRGLRPRLESSPLMDVPRFTRHLETAFRGMWREWCRGS